MVMVSTGCKEFAIAVMETIHIQIFIYLLHPLTNSTSPFYSFFISWNIVVNIELT